MIKKELEHLEFSQGNNITFPHEVIGLELKYNNIIKAWRLYLKKSQKDVAATAGISAAALSQIEKPGSTPQQATIRKIARAMAINPEQLTAVD